MWAFVPPPVLEVHMEPTGGAPGPFGVELAMVVSAWFDVLCL